MMKVREKDSKKKGIFVGICTVDIISYTPFFVGKNSKIDVEKQLLLAGGLATNSAIAFSALGNYAHLITALGCSYVAQIAKQDIKDNKVGLIDIKRDRHSLPVISTVRVNLKTGDRSVVYKKPKTPKLDLNQIPKNICKDASVVLVDANNIEACIYIAKNAKEVGAYVVLDGDKWNQGIEMLLPFVDYAICSEVFLPNLKYDEIFNCLNGYGIKNIAITRGGKSIIVNQEGKISQIFIPKVEIKDTLGAGDILHGAFCHYISQNNDFKRSLLYASEIASFSCLFFGTREWIEKRE